MEKMRSKKIGKIGFTFSALICIILCFGIILAHTYSRLYPCLFRYKYFFSFIVLFAIPFFISIFCLIKFQDLSKKIKIMLIFGLIISLVVACCSIPLFLLATPMISKTHDLSDYLITDEWISKDNSYKELFPQSVPSTMQNGYYFYCFDNNVFSPSLDIFAKWSLPEIDYQKEKQRVFSIYPDGETVINSSSGLTDYYIIDNDYIKYPGSDVITHYDYLIFSYSDDTNTVQYLYTYAGGVDPQLEHPYFYREKEFRYN